MYEVEVKARIHDAEATLRRLESAGLHFSGPYRQTDTVFAVDANVVLRPAIGVTVLRIREDGKRSILSLKQHRSNELDVLEHETDVSDREAAVGIILALGYSVVATVTKHRYICRSDRTTLCVDRVDDLGDFVEIEAIYHNEPPKGAQAALAGQLQELLKEGLVERVAWGYDRLLLTQGGAV